MNIGSIAGTAIRIHITFLLFLVWIFAAGWSAGGPQAAMEQPGLRACCCSPACWPHEFGHIFTARAFGVATPDVTLLPIGGVARLERIPEKPSEEFLIAIAGPAGQCGDRGGADSADADAFRARHISPRWRSTEVAHGRPARRR